MFKIRAIIISVLILVNCNLLNAEGFLSANYNFSKSNTSQNVSNLTPDFVCFSNFSEISSINRGVSLGYIQKINNWYSIGASIGYTDNYINFSSYNNLMVGIDGTLYQGVVLSRIGTNSDLYNFAFDFGIFEVYKNLLITTSFSYTGSGKTVYDKYEQLVEPVNQGVFQETQTRIRNQAEGKMDYAFQSYSFLLSARYQIPVFTTMDSEDLLFIVPEMEFGYSFTKFYQSDYWHNGAIKLKLGLQYSI
ncbi:MAG: hypothetical protein WCR42_03735 [bacterium]